mgnify:FL=1
MKMYKQLSELGDIVTGKTPSTANNELWGGTTPFITPTDIEGYDTYYQEITERTVSAYGASRQQKTLLPPNSVCVTCIGSTIGKPCITKSVSITNQQINSIIPNKENDYRYIYYLIRESLPYFQLIGGGSGSGTPIISKNKFARLKFPIEPNLKKQRKIASILSAYDSLIENNAKRIRLLEQMAENLYKEWFAYSKISKLSTEVRLADILSYSRGLSYSSEEIDCEDGNDLINLKNIQSFGGFRLDGTKKYNGKYKKEQVVKEGDLIMGVTDMTQDRRTVGSVALIPDVYRLSIISADLIKLESNINTVYLYAMFRWGNVSKYISQFANGANVLHLKPQVLKNIKVTLPPKPLIAKYVSIVKPMFDTINKLNTANDSLTKQRDALLPRLMSGELEVKA